MAASCFANKTEIPNEKDVKEKLGDSNVHWAAIKEFIHNEQGEVSVEWKHYGAKTGWLGKHLVKKRNILFLIPQENSFRISMTFGEKAVKQIQNSNLPKSIITAVNEAKKYAEGRSIQIPINGDSDIWMIKSLIEIKLQH